MADEVFCGQCGEPIQGEPLEQRKPCPKCGSMTRSHPVVSKMSHSSSVTLNPFVITYPQKLLSIARKLIDDGEVAIAIVVAHMACEIATERTMSEAFAAKSASYLEDSVMDFLNGYSLANNRIRKLYTALTGDQVEKAAFWQAFKASAELRNKIVHSTITVTKADAEDSHSAASALVAHLKK